MGSGGNFLTRLLTLSEKTIPRIKHELIHVDQVATEMTAQERFDLYNHFDIWEPKIIKKPVRVGVTTK